MATRGAGGDQPEGLCKVGFQVLKYPWKDRLLMIGGGRDEAKERRGEERRKTVRGGE